MPQWLRTSLRLAVVVLAAAAVSVLGLCGVAGREVVVHARVVRSIAPHTSAIPTKTDSARRLRRPDFDIRVRREPGLQRAAAWRRVGIVESPHACAVVLVAGHQSELRRSDGDPHQPSPREYHSHSLAAPLAVPRAWSTCYPWLMTQPSHARAWLRQRERGAVAVATVERDELRRLDPVTALSQSEALLSAAPIAEMVAGRIATSGFVEQQRLFSRARNR